MLRLIAINFFNRAINRD